MRRYQHLIALLEETNRSQLQDVRARHPSVASVLTSARELGDSADAAASVTKTLPKDARDALLNIVKLGTESVNKQVEELATSIRRQMIKVNRMRFCGAIIATVSGAVTAILQYANLGAQAVTTVGAVVSMLGGLTTLFADQFEKAPSGVRIASLEEYGKMTEMRGDVERIRIRLGRDSLVTISDDDLRAMLERLDGYALQVIRLRLA